MLDANTHYEFRGLPVPMEMLRAICKKITAAWPFVGICVMSVCENGLSERLDKDIYTFKILASDVTLRNDELLENYSDIFIPCIKEQRSYFQGSDAHMHPDLLAVIPLLLYAENNDAFELADRCEDKPAYECLKKCLFSFWRRDKSALIFKQTDQVILDIVIEQLNLYNKLYSIMKRYNWLLGKFRHDLRTPLTSVTMIGGLLEQDQDNGELREVGQMLLAASEKMDALLNEFRSEVQS